MKSKFPKVLIISEFFFGEKTGGQILLKNLFEKYPKEKIFILHEDLYANTDIPVRSYLLKNPSKISYFIKKFFHPFIIQFLIDLKNFITVKKKKKVTSDLLVKLKEFKPDVIYTIFGSYGLMCMIKELKIKLRIPLVTHVMDNVLAIYENNEKEFTIFKDLINNSNIRIAINSKMSVEYKKIFNYNFEILHNGVDRQKIQKVGLTKKIKVITYIGSVFKNAQLDSLVEITKAVKNLMKNNPAIKCFIYLPKSQKRIYESYFAKSEHIYIKNHNLNDKDYFQKISESSILLLASNFDKNSIDYYRYSWPAKMGSYLMSKVPILIYGPDKIFFINDAIKKKWAYVESEKSLIKLEESLKKILYNSNLRKQTLKYALKKSKDFELKEIQKKLVNLLKSA